MENKAKSKLPSMVQVESSNVDKVGFDTATKLMYVKFKDRVKKDKTKVQGKTYSYEGVTHEQYLEMIASESVGKYMAKNIKDQPGIIPKVTDFS